MIHNFYQISVVIPCYNTEKWIARAINCVLAQVGVSIQLIVIDDGSTDGSIQVIRTYGDRIHWESRSNRGACAARNRGLELVSTEYVMFLDADDWIEGNFLCSAFNSLHNSDADIAFGRLIAKTTSERKIYEPPSVLSSKEMMRYFLQTSFIPPCSTAWRADFIRSIGGWREEIRRNQDFEIVFRALAKNPRIVSIPEGAGVYFQHSSSGRISARNDLQTIHSQISVLNLIGSYLKEAGYEFDEINQLRLRKAYQLWRQAARSSSIDAEQQAKEFYYEIGGRFHLGSKYHVILSTLLGLRTKEYFANMLYLLQRKSQRN